MNALLERNSDFTALFAMSDVMAIGAIRALKDAGKRVPEDISVIGLDGLEIGTYLLPRLSTVAQSAKTLAEQSLELLMNSVKHKGANTHRILPVQVEHRESTVKIG